MRLAPTQPLALRRGVLRSVSQPGGIGVRFLLLTFIAAAALASCGANPASSAPAAAAPDLISALTSPGACFTRVYDAAHLAAHPNQTVTHFSLGDPGENWRATQSADHFNLAFSFQITAGADVYSGVAICQPAEGRVNCDVEGDGGNFALAADGDGLRVTVTRLQAEGANDFSPDLAEADNRVMLLRRAASGACTAQ